MTASDRVHSAHAVSPPSDRTRTVQLTLLACGIVGPLIYAASDLIAGMRWEGYSFRDQTISELNAMGSPVRELTVVLGLLGYAFLLAFGVGVWRSTPVSRALRVAGGAVVAFSLAAFWAVPFASMHVREAEESLGDTLHLVSLGIALPLLMGVIGFGAAAFGTRFRVYSVATVLVMLAFGAWSGMDGGRVADDLSTPWIGVKERMSVYAYQLWLALFAVALIRRQAPGYATARSSPPSEGARPRG